MKCLILVPFFLYLPYISPRKIYTQDGSLGESVNSHLDKKVESGEFVAGLYFYPFLENEPYNIAAVPAELKENDLTHFYLACLLLSVK